MSTVVAADGELDPAVLRQPALGDVEVRHDLDPAARSPGPGAGAAGRARRARRRPGTASCTLPRTARSGCPTPCRLIASRSTMFRSFRTGAASAISSIASRSIVFSLRFGELLTAPCPCSISLTTSWIDSCLPGVEPLDRRHHLALGGDHPLDLDPQERPEAVQRRRVLRLGHRDRDALVLLVLRDRHDLEGRRHRLVDQLGQLGRDGHVAELDHLHAELLAQRLEDLVLVDQARAGRRPCRSARCRSASAPRGPSRGLPRRGSPCPPGSCRAGAPWIDPPRPGRRPPGTPRDRPIATAGVDGRLDESRGAGAGPGGPRQTGRPGRRAGRAAGRPGGRDRDRDGARRRLIHTLIRRRPRPT